MKEKIRPIYSELQGYLKEAPKSGDKDFNVYDKNALGDFFNNSIQRLEEITGKDYSIFRNEIQRTENGLSFFNIHNYRAKISGFIAHLHGEFFRDEPAPFRGMPSTIINQSQNQSQETFIQILLDLRSVIDEKIEEYDEDSKEKTFLEKVKGSLAGIKNVTELISLIIGMAKNTGLTIDNVSEIFS